MILSKRHTRITIALSVLLLIVLVVWELPSHGIENKKIRYRFKVSTANDLNPNIADAERRVRSSGSALETAYLAELYYARAKSEGGNGSFMDKAAETAQQALREIPHLPKATSVLVKVMQSRHQFEESLKLIAATPDLQSSPTGATLRITAHLGLGELVEAHREADFLVDQLPGTSTYTLMAQVLEARGFVSEAMFYFDRALVVEDAGDPAGSAWTRALMGRFYLRRGDHASAAKLLSESLRIEPRLVFGIGVKGDLAFQSGHLDAADRHYQEAFLLSKDPVFTVRRASVKLQKNDRASAAALLGEAENLLRQEIQRGAYGHRAQLAQVLLEKGSNPEIKEALALVEEEASRRRNSETLQIYARALRRAGQWRRAQNIAHEILRTGIQSAESYFEASLIERQFKNFALADFYAKKAKTINPEFRELIEPPLPIMIN